MYAIKTVFDPSFVEVVKPIAVLQQRGNVTTELRLIRYKGSSEPVYDIRKWQHNPDGTERMFKGISLTADAWAALVEAIRNMGTEATDA